jgi:glycosyltransferase 2 family protein
MKTKFGKWTKFTLRWGIAVLGITWVLAKTSFHDRVMVLNSKDHPMQVRVVDGAGEDATAFVNYYTRAVIPREQVWTASDQPTVEISGPNSAAEKAKVLAVHPAPDQRAHEPPMELLIQDPKTENPRKILPSQVIGGYEVRVPYPLVDVGLIRLVRQANPWYLLIALLILPISYLITSYRWHLLLETVDIHIGIRRAFVLNMVGSFYNSFMPGSTGGDVAKAYYAAKHTTHRTRAVMSVIIDRILGLLALILLGGAMAGLQHRIPTCRRVAYISCGLILLTCCGLFVFYHPLLRRKTGLAWLLKRLPMQKQVKAAVEAMEMYGHRPWAALAAIAMTLPVHMTTIVSATFAGKAFGLPLSPLYYWAIVPVITLVGALPISPQGAGVMEWMAVELTQQQGVAVSQAFALVMAIRFCAIFWNLAASIFVLRGGYHAPTEKEAETLEKDEDEEGSGAGIAGSGLRVQGSEGRGTPAGNSSPVSGFLRSSMGIEGGLIPNPEP